MQLLLIYLALILLPINSFSQIRAKIDEERKGVDLFDKKGLELSKKFIKWDKSYYVGYMYEGAYKYNRASDYLGYKNAIPPLEEALNKLEKDYNGKLKTRSSDFFVFINNYQYQLDYSWLCYYLYECYSNIEKPVEAMAILQRLAKKRFQKDLYCQPYISMSWIAHRYRYHNSEKYPFLKNSIEENELLALKYLDSSYNCIKQNYALNTAIFNAGHEQSDFNSIYFNKTLIYSYNFEIDSSEYYYNLLKGTYSFSENNYAYTKLMNCEFREAMHYFNIEKNNENFAEKNTKEFYYMLALLNIYKAKPETGIKELHEIISKLGSTPGFGWNNLGLSRGYYYNGQLVESEKHLQKAKEFQEMHIGTTWAPEHYDFTNSIFTYLNKKRKLESIPFENKNYWYNVGTLAKLIPFWINKQTEKFILINKFGANPERDYVYYHLFSPENTITFDEIWSIIEGLDADFFIKKFSTYLKEDPRENCKRYYLYFIGKLLLTKGEYEQAEKYLLQALQDEKIDIDHEKLFVARIHEALCSVYEQQNNAVLYTSHLNEFYATFPQLVPFSEHKMSFNLDFKSSLAPEKEKIILEELKATGINFLEDKNPIFPTAFITLSQKDSVISIQCRVETLNGLTVSNLPHLQVDETEGTGKKIAYYLFNIPVTEVQKVEENNYWILAGIMAILLLLVIAHRAKQNLKF